EGAKAKTGKIKFGAALQIIAALLYAGGVIYLIVTKDLGWGLITLLSLIIPVVVVAFAALLKLAAASKIKKFKLSSVNPAEVAYPYGGVPMGANIQESSRGYVYTPASAPVQQPIVNPNDPVFRLDTMFRNGLITREQYLNELEKLQSGKK
ncbi:MAG TPA: hypothetical protein PK245_06440, partial [Clostridia bacterium]|nr:hypothetical protein [Clostridia bacterium]